MSSRSHNAFIPYFFSKFKNSYNIDTHLPTNKQERFLWRVLLPELLSPPYLISQVWSIINIQLKREVVMRHETQLAVSFPDFLLGCRPLSLSLAFSQHRPFMVAANREISGRQRRQHNMHCLARFEDCLCSRFWHMLLESDWMNAFIVIFNILKRLEHEIKRVYTILQKRIKMLFNKYFHIFLFIFWL